MKSFAKNLKSLIIRSKKQIFITVFVFSFLIGSIFGFYSSFMWSARSSITRAEDEIINARNQGLNSEILNLDELERNLEQKKSKLKISNLLSIDEFESVSAFASSTADSIKEEVEKEREISSKELNKTLTLLEERISRANNLEIDQINELKEDLGQWYKTSSSEASTISDLREINVLSTDKSENLQREINRVEKELTIISITESVIEAEELLDFFSKNYIYKEEQEKLKTYLEKVKVFLESDTVSYTLDEVREFSLEVSHLLNDTRQKKQELDEEYMRKRAEWIESEKSKREAQNLGPAPEVPVKDEDKVIYVVLSEQTMYLYDKGELIYSTYVTTGKNGFSTVTGDFALYAKRRNVKLISPFTTDKEDPNWYELVVDYWMPFFEGYGIHDAYWRSRYGGADYQWAGSHGCINTPYSAVQFIWNWAEVGTPVIVRNSR